MKHKLFNYTLLLILIAITAGVLISGSEFSIIPHLKDMTDLRLLVVAVFCMLVFWFFDALIFRSILKITDIQISLFRYLKITFIGQYYNMITPFASGGQPFQVYTMTSDYKVPVGVATSATINKYMVFHFITTVYAMVMAIFNAGFIFNQGLISKALIYLGLAINIAGVVAVFLICYNTTVIEKLTVMIIRLLQKFKLAMQIDDLAISLHIAEYKSSLMLFLANKRALIYVTLYTFVQVTAYFSVTYFVYLSLGLSGSTFWQILAVQSILYTAVNIIPTPGNAGASEGIFFLLFGLIFPKNLMISAIILWRLIIYYLNLIVSGIIVLIDFLHKRYHAKSTTETNPAK